MGNESFHIVFERSGGFAGLTSSVKVDSKDLSHEEAEKVRNLIEESGFFELEPDETSSGGRADQYQYTLTIFYEGNKKTLNLVESSVPGSLRPLIDYLVQKARGKK